ELARGRELIAKVVAGLGGADALDRIESLRIGRTVRRHGDLNPGEECLDELTFDFSKQGQLSLSIVEKCSGLFLTSVESQIESGGVLRMGDPSAQMKTANWAARNEFLAQNTRELVFLLRQRDKGGLCARGTGVEKVNGEELERLILNWNGHDT